MQRVPYNLNEAKHLCKELQHLVGQPFDPTISSVAIECIAVSPFDAANKKNFLFFYLLSEDADKSLNEEYTGLLYDVIVIARAADDANELLHYNIGTWLSKNNLSMDMVHGQKEANNYNGQDHFLI